MKLHIGREIKYSYCQLKMERTFHPVGQGAFYTEVFYDRDCNQLSVVYDCGSNRPEVDRINCINKFRREYLRGRDSEIDLLFISHFHADHINGLEQLLEGVNVGRTVIPMLSDEILLLTRVTNYLTYGERAEEADLIIRELYFQEGRGRFGDVRGVAPAMYENELSNNNVNRFPRSSPIRSGEKIPFVEGLWEYVPFNSVPLTDSRAVEFKERLAEIDGDVKYQEKLKIGELIKKHREEIKMLYRDVMKYANDNLYTLVVKSSQVDGVQVDPDPFLARCLYMGDYYPTKESWHRLTNTFSCDKIGTIQVPHHGSRKNFRDELLKVQNKKFLISVGSKNPSHHPDFWLVKKICDTGSLVQVVSEDPGSIYKRNYSIY